MSSQIKLIDIAVNLTDGMFQGNYRGKQVHEGDLDKVLERAWSNGIDRIIITGTSLKESEEAINLAQSDDRLYATVGVHPTNSDDFEKEGADPTEHLRQLGELIASAPGKVVAIGECGLDYDRLEFSSKETQLKYFEKQLHLAREHKLPMFLHNRNTGGDFARLVSEHKPADTLAVAHSFTGSSEELKELLDLGLYIGVNGCSLKTAENLEVVKHIPLERLVIETDAPWCDIRPTHAGYEHVKTTFPQKSKPKSFEMGLCVKARNEPCHLRQVLEVVAGVMGQDVEVVASATYQNSLKLFGLDNNN